MSTVAAKSVNFPVPIRVAVNFGILSDITKRIEDQRNWKNVRLRVRLKRYVPCAYVRGIRHETEGFLERYEAIQSKSPNTL